MDKKKLERVTVPGVMAMKKAGQRIVALTCYDYTMARLLNEAGVDLLLVGDSLGMVKLGYASTLPVTVDDMAYHTRIVARGNTRALLVTDMPYLSYHASPEEAVRNCGRMLKLGAQAVKIEGGSEMAPVIRALLAAKIPVMGHLGLTPQSVNLFGGFKVQGRERAARQKLLKEAQLLERLGVFSIVLECVPIDLARRITRALTIPTIGIGAGPSCDGQILVTDDFLGLTPPPHPRFVKTYADLRAIITQAARCYGREVRSGQYPDPSHAYSG
ncbi:MAG: 3-methyl-2-oxobutanoate hydroxymethyltransferase [Elusimicrobiota bacterium]|jgi:3-methyl-2-oxobutanoate hydroxymethyltransferase